ncbi:MAG: acyl-CoA thioesterase II [Actinomycetota bacterium]
MWWVERVRDGRSFSNRTVIGSQGGKEVFRAMLSLHVPEDGFEFQPTMDVDPGRLPEPDEVSTTYVEFCDAHPDLEPGDWFGEDRPMDIRYIDAPSPGSGPPITSPQRTWTRISEPLGDDPRLHHAALLYLSDATLIDHVLLPHGHRWSDPRLTGASLDHAMWLYRQTRADDWLLFDQRVELTGGARGLAIGRFHQRSGEQVATCTQEGLIRWDDR